MYERRDAAWKAYKNLLEEGDNRALARESFNEGWEARKQAQYKEAFGLTEAN